MPSYAQVGDKLVTVSAEMKSHLCRVVGNQKKLQFAVSQFQKFSESYQNTHTSYEDITEDEEFAFDNLLYYAQQLRNVIGQNLDVIWLQNTLNGSSQSVAAEICKIIEKMHTNSLKLDGELSSIFDSGSQYWLQYHLIDLQVISQSIQAYISKPEPVADLPHFQNCLDSINNFIEEYKDEAIIPKGRVFSPIPIHYQSWRIGMNDFEMQEMIGKGVTARVYKGIMKSTQQSVAIKRLKTDELKGNKFRAYQREISVMASAQYPTILKFIGATDSPPYTIITEWMGGGDLYHNIHDHLLTGTQLTQIAFDLARGMAYLHDHGIVHRDLKSLNVLLDDNKNAKICDFGMARKTNSVQNLNSLVGTYYWMAPELFEQNPKYTSKVDVYSYGITLWEMLTGRIPYDKTDPQTIVAQVRNNGLRPAFPPNIDENLEKLIVMCWSQAPDDRPTFQDIITIFTEGKTFFPNSNVNKAMEYILQIVQKESLQWIPVTDMLNAAKSREITLDEFVSATANLEPTSELIGPCWDLFQSIITCRYEAIQQINSLTSNKINHSKYSGSTFNKFNGVSKNSKEFNHSENDSNTLNNSINGLQSPGDISNKSNHPNNNLDELNHLDNSLSDLDHQLNSENNHSNNLNQQKNTVNELNNHENGANESNHHDNSLSDLNILTETKSGINSANSLDNDIYGFNQLTRDELSTISIGLNLFLSSSFGFQAAYILKHFPRLTLPVEVIQSCQLLMPNGDEKFDEYLLTILCKNGRSEEALLRCILPSHLRLAFVVISRLPNEISSDYLDAVLARCILSISNKDDKITSAYAMECLVSLSSAVFSNQCQSISSDNITKFFSIPFVDSVSSFCKSLMKLPVNITGIEKKAQFASLLYFAQMAISGIDYNGDYFAIFDALFVQRTTNNLVIMIMKNLLAKSSHVCSQFINWLNVADGVNLEKLTAESLIVLLAIINQKDEFRKSVAKILIMDKFKLEHYKDEMIELNLINRES